jgi:choline dehydrogenase-like flavoprotein
MSEKLDVVIIGAGPSGAAAAAFLRKKGRSVEVIEKTHFPRFSIGESLLAQSVAILEDAGLMPAVEAGGFQYKDGAAFQYKDDYKDIYFPDKSAEGPGTTIQVMRSKFDKILADGAAEMGAKVVYGEEGGRGGPHHRGALLPRRQRLWPHPQQTAGHRGAVQLPTAPGRLLPGEGQHRRPDLRPEQDPRLDPSRASPRLVLADPAGRRHLVDGRRGLAGDHQGGR